MAKKTHAEARYEAVAKSNDRCGRCRWFEAPRACDIVESPIGERGWCKYFHAKAGSFVGSQKDDRAYVQAMRARDA